MTLIVGDCREVMAGMDAASFDAVVCDPPYGLEFMGKEWDKLTDDLPNAAAWKGRRATKPITKRSDDGPCETPWAKESSGYRGNARQSFKRCSKCGKRSFSGSPCRCPNPEWVIEYPEGPPTGSVAMQRWHESWLREAYRVLKPGGHLLAFGGTRTHHRLMCAVEDAGFEIRDTLMWLYGSGFPKSLDVGKAFDKVKDRSKLSVLSAEIKRAREESGLSLTDIGAEMQRATDGQYGKWYHRGGHMFFETGMSLPSRPEWAHLRHVLPIGSAFADVYDEAEREVIGHHRGVPGLTANKGWNDGPFTRGETGDITAPATDLARRWDGWGTALKPAWEPIILARKPLAGTVAANVAKYGTGALNIDGCRIEGAPPSVPQPAGKSGTGLVYGFKNGEGRSGEMSHALGRWPANVALDEEAAALLDEMSGITKSSGGRIGKKAQGAVANVPAGQYRAGNPGLGDTGGASRFFGTFAHDAHSDSFMYNEKDKECAACGDESTEAESTSAGKKTESNGGNSQTDGPGSRQTALFQTDTKSIISTKTRSTTTLATSNACPKDGTTTTTNEGEKITGSLTASRNDVASGATNTNRSPNSPDAPLEPFTATANRARENHSESGETATESTTTNTSAPIVSGEWTAPRFLYTPKASRRERGEYNDHPTVKPLALMRWLVRLACPPGGRVLDPFAGSGTTLIACDLEGFEGVGVEMDEGYAEIAERRRADATPPLFRMVAD